VRISRVRLARLRVPLRTPFKTALRTVESIDDVVVMIDTDTGHVGWGEAPPTAAITGETRESIIAAIRGHLAPALIGADLADIGRIASLVEGAVARNGSAKAAVEIAAYDLHAQLQGLSLHRALGGTDRRLTTDITVSVDETGKMVADALDAVARRFDALKIKVGLDIAEDVERVKAIHAAVAGRASLRLDANQGWTPQQAVHALELIEAAGIVLDLVEQPVRADDLDGLEYVTRHVATPVMADESVFNLAQAREIVRRRAADIVNIKLMKTGGITNALAIADLCAAHGVECMMGSMLEAGISVAAAAHVAAARPGVITRVDLDGPQLAALDPIEGGATFDGPTILLADASGLGIRSVRGLESLPA
jgi:o-succinylbenzoate synthase